MSIADSVKSWFPYALEFVTPENNTERQLAAK